MRQQIRKISIDGLKPFAKGATGECFRLEEDSVLKLYYDGFPMEMIEREKKCAKTAFIASIPTAISFHIVEAGSRLGIVYEYVSGKTLSELTAADPTEASHFGRIFGKLAALLHGADASAAELSLATAEVREAMKRVDYLSEDALARIYDFLDELDKEKSFVHGDFHPNNVIITKDGPMLIDMGGFSIGSPLFDLATTYFSLFASPDAVKGGRSEFNGLNHEEAQAFWDGCVEAYFGEKGLDDDTRARLMKVVLLKKLWFERMYGEYFKVGDYSKSVCDEVKAVFEA